MATEVKVAKLPDCDICKGNPAEYYGKTLAGPWAYMCHACWILHGVGQLGTGFGQRLIEEGK